MSESPSGFVSSLFRKMDGEFLFEAGQKLGNLQH